jgi:NADPH-dependent 2,4-dienoyl-CoA reductase/sulfur reductase-like enzyme
VKSRPKGLSIQVESDAGIKGGGDMTSETVPRVLPEDQHNQVLVSNISPPGWRNLEPSDRSSLVVIGGGAIGSELSQAFQRLGSRVTVFEAGDHLPGGADSDATARIVIQKALFLGSTPSCPTLEG